MAEADNITYAPLGAGGIGEGVRDQIAELEAQLDLARTVVDTGFAELQALAQFGTAVDARLLLGKLLNHLYDLLYSALPYQRIGFSLVEPDQQTVRAVWARSEAPVVRLSTDYAARLTGSSLAAVLQTRQPRIINNLPLYLRDHPDSHSTHLIVAEGMRSSLTCPLIVSDRPVGFLFFSGFATDTYNLLHVELVRGLAACLSRVVEQGLLYQKVLELNSSTGNPAEAPAGRRLAAAQVPKARLQTILCADDDPITNHLYQAVLGAHGYDVHVCGTGAEALAALATVPADLVITNADLPDMAGIELCRQVRQLPQGNELRLMVALPTGRADLVPACFEAPADDILFKPVRPAELLGKLAMPRRRAFRLAGGAQLPIGAEFAGKYQILKKLGSGGFSTVYYAAPLTGDLVVPVALKVFSLPPSGQGAGEGLTGILREAYEHSRLRHPNIVRLLDFGQSDDAYFLVMEYVQGMTLMELVDESGPLAEGLLVFITYEVAKALDYMHECGVVHRDIKSRNLMITEAGDVKVLDLGLARTMTEPAGTTEEFLGTPHYVSPDCIVDESRVDIRSDVYSLGVALYRAAAGQYPFQGATPEALMQQHLHREPRPLHEVQPTCSRDFCEWVGRMMAKDPARRPWPHEIRQHFRDLLKQASR